MTRYFRNSRGTVVHTSWCDRKGGTAVPWEWAEDRSDPEIGRVMARHRIRACAYCDPPLRPLTLRVVNDE